jgi:hypothetical protein
MTELPNEDTREWILWVDRYNRINPDAHDARKVEVVPKATCVTRDQEIKRLNEEIELWHTKLENSWAQVKELREALEFYADPGTYFAIMLIGDPPHGPFLDDVGHKGKPGERARSALASSKSKEGQ